ncbi:MAG TPA: YcfL family protein [Planctomycetota bacterium]|nr:YcfL family protein [Planctomycetota bacterium]
MRPFACLSLALAAASCRSAAVYSVTVDTSRMEQVSSGTVEGTIEVQPGGAILARRIEVSPPRRREASGVVEVQFELRNRTLREQRFDVRFEWADAAGMNVDSPSTHWTPIVLGGNEKRPVAGTAPQLDAVRCTLKVRLSR